MEKQSTCNDNSKKQENKENNSLEFNESNSSELIYYGGPGIECFLSSVPGEFYEFRKENFFNYRNNDTISVSLSHLYNQRQLGIGYENIFLPSVPANDIQIKPLELVISSESELSKTHKDILSSAFVKVNKDRIKGKNEESGKDGKDKESKCLFGWKSGVRSAIVPLNNSFYRLKGCGNHDEGFILRKLACRKDGQEIRGCQFKHTSVREVFMSDYINGILKNEGFESANKPLGIYFYGDIARNEQALKDEKKRITKTCGVFETLGEKRVGCHLMPGIEMLFIPCILNYLKDKPCDQLGKYDHAKLNCNHGLINLIKGTFVEERWIRKTLPKSEEELQRLKEQEEREKQEEERKRKEREARQEPEDEKKTKADRENISKITVPCQQKPKLNFNQPITELSNTFQHINVLNITMDQTLDSLFSDYRIYQRELDIKHFSDFTAISEKAKYPSSHEVFAKSNALFFTNNHKEAESRQEMEFTREIPNLRYENLDFARYLFNDDRLKEQEDVVSAFMKRRVGFCNVDSKLSRVLGSSKNTSNNTNNSNKSLCFLSCLLYYRLGWEIGKVKRVLQDHNISWGTFEDLPFRYHCNAHTDNLVVIPYKLRKAKSTSEKIKAPNLLAVLDFDLAYLKENFVSLSLDITEKYGEFDQFLFDNYLNGERQHLEWELSGMENMSIFTFVLEFNNKGIFNDDEVRVLEGNNFNLCFNTLVYLLRDNSVLGYQEGYLLREFRYQELFEKHYHEISELIELGLLASYDFLG